MHLPHPHRAVRPQAILHVQDKLFWEDTDYLEFGPTPSLQDRVLVAGYPTGGDTISITSGVVSRAEVQRYAHGGTNLLALQIDASINPGNSGGPVLLDDENLTSVGVAFQSLTQAESVGYVATLRRPCEQPAAWLGPCVARSVRAL